MKPIRKRLNKELRRLAKQHTANRKRLEWIDKDIEEKLRERNKLQSETDEIGSRIEYLKRNVEKARK